MITGGAAVAVSILAVLIIAGVGLWIIGGKE